MLSLGNTEKNCGKLSREYERRDCLGYFEFLHKGHCDDLPNPDELKQVERVYMRDVKQSCELLSDAFLIKDCTESSIDQLKCKALKTAIKNGTCQVLSEEG